MLEDEIPGTGRPEAPPRATLVLPAGARANRTAIWMGGAHSLGGVDVVVEQMREAWLVETAGDMPAAYHQTAARTLYCVFADIEEVPSVIERIHATAAAIAAASRLGAQAPPEAYIVCSQGLNRSALVTGLVLRHLGIPGAEAIELIRRTRPGALTNSAFEKLVMDASFG